MSDDSKKSPQRPAKEPLRKGRNDGHIPFSREPQREGVAPQPNQPIPKPPPPQQDKG